ncbi:hypothetical protein BJF88_04100 [Cellulosimicrobium sp. CUA-896]|nr:DUF5302 domain-containing protein [Cellulosimicrobium sp. CUA-896]OLT46789.1 hypothetical protein BJF88_04100 [Cellulosimicrobium sp. CUA-896]
MDGPSRAGHRPPSEGDGHASDEQRPTPTGPSEEARAKFREALDRKNAARHRSADGGTNTGAVHGSETAGPVQRTFRRKSG